jgi:hypothetical protein
MSKYATNTSVGVDRSKAEIERTLTRYGASEFAYATKPTMAVIGFRIANRAVKMTLPLPDPGSRQFTHTANRGTRRTESQAYTEWEQACRQRWRALALVIKAKLEAVESGISTVENEFMAHIMLPDGITVGEFLAPQIELSYRTQGMPQLLPGLVDKPMLTSGSVECIDREVVE